MNISCRIANANTQCGHFNRNENTNDNKKDEKEKI